MSAQTVGEGLPAHVKKDGSSTKMARRAKVSKYFQSIWWEITKEHKSSGLLNQLLNLMSLKSTIPTKLLITFILSHIVVPFTVVVMQKYYVQK